MKARKFAYGEVHSGNNKQSMPLALAIFDESTTAANHADIIEF